MNSHAMELTQSSPDVLSIIKRLPPSPAIIAIDISRYFVNTQPTAKEEGMSISTPAPSPSQGGHRPYHVPTAPSGGGSQGRHRSSGGGASPAPAPAPSAPQVKGSHVDTRT